MSNAASWSQASQRRLGRWTDEHGRPWFAMIEIKSGDPCERLRTEGWKAPLMPDPRYVKVHPNKPGMVEIKYDQWIGELRAATKAWVKKANLIGSELYKDQFDPEAPLSQAVLFKAGPRPKPVEPVLAAKQGNRWVLGLLGPSGETPKMPEGLAVYFVKPVEIEARFADEYEDELEEDAPEDLVTVPARRGRPPKAFNA